MTATLNEIREWLDERIAFKDDRHAAICKAIRAKLAEQDANTLPMELLPEGWRIFNVEMRFDEIWKCTLRSSNPNIADLSAIGNTQRAAMLSAIAKITDRS